MRGFGGRGFGRHRRHGGGRSRPFEHGELRFVLLQLLAEAPRHGYELIKAIEEGMGGAYSPSPGVIYPTLTMLEELGYATVAESDGKKLYAVTPAGQAFLDANRATVDAIFERMQGARGSFAAPPILRAVENLKMALSLKLAEPNLDEDRIRKIAAAIDATAIQIERS
jgi:DNA-binding PadR family transcriptional regulator